MQNTKQPLALVTFGNIQYKLYTTLLNKVCTVAIYKVIANDYTGTDLQALFPADEVLYANRTVDTVDEVFAAQIVGGTEIWPVDDTRSYDIRFNSEYCYYSPATKAAIDCLNSSTGRTQINGRTYNDIVAEYPDIQLLTWDEVANIQRNAAISKFARPITKAAFWDALECLMPLNWVRREHTESFRMSEFYTHDITGIYVRVGENYFTFLDRVSMSHEEAVERTKSLAPFSINELPERAYVKHPSDDNQIIEIVRGEMGFTPVVTEHSLKDLNADYGVTSKHAEAMLVGSMFGWDVPGVAQAARA